MAVVEAHGPEKRMRTRPTQARTLTMIHTSISESISDSRGSRTSTSRSSGSRALRGNEDAKQGRATTGTYLDINVSGLTSLERE
jgi:hypothetical protein